MDVQTVSLIRPSIAARLLIRLEDFLPHNPDEDFATEFASFEQQQTRLKNKQHRLVKQLGEATQGVLSGKGTHAEKARVQKALHDSRAQSARIQSRSLNAAATGEQQGDLFSITLNVVPLKASVELNTYRSADTCSITLPFRDVPLESQNIRSCLLEVTIGTISAEDFATRGRWRMPMDRGSLIFRGYVDDWETTHDDTDAVVNIKARSLDALLLDAKINSMSPIFRVKKGGEKISAYVDRVIATIPSTSGRTGGDQLKSIFYHANIKEEPSINADMFNRSLQSAKSRAQGTQGATTGGGGVPVQSDANTNGETLGTDTGATPPGQGTGTGDPSIARPVTEEVTAWDLICQACYFAGGLVPTYDPSFTETVKGSETLGDFILIRPPQTIYEKSRQGVYVEGGPADGFKRTLPDPNAPTTSFESQIRFMVWGHNIKKVTTNRKLGRVKVPGIEISSYNPDAPPAERWLRVQYPSKEVMTRMGAKGEGKSVEIIKRTIRGVRDKKALMNAAVALYHAVGRNELTVSIETDNLASFGTPDTQAQSDTADLLKLRHGSLIRLLVARQLQDPTGEQYIVSSFSEVFERRTGELRKFMLEQGGRFIPDLDPDLRIDVLEAAVKRMETTINSAKRVDIFYVRTVRHGWDVEDGWTGSFDLVNFVEARNLPENISKTDAKADAKFRLSPGSRKPTVKQQAQARAAKAAPRSK